MPLNAPIEGGSQSRGDRHAISIDVDNCILYELYRAFPQRSSWQADSGAIFNLPSHLLRPATWTSADAAGLPIFPGLVRYDEVLTGEIRHAIRFTVPQTRNTFIWPARHKASSLTGTQYPPMGQRFRLKAGFNISGFSATNQVILRALKKYGMILADNGSAWFMSGAPDVRWNNTGLNALRNVLGSNFEAVDESSLMTTSQAVPVAVTNPDGGLSNTATVDVVTPPVTVTVSPASANVRVRQTAQFTATVQNTPNTAVTWKVNGIVGGSSTVGTITTGGLYTAPGSPGTFQVTATSQADPSASGNATVTVEKGGH